MQINASLDLRQELSLIDAAGTGFKSMPNLHAINYKQGTASAYASECKLMWAGNMIKLCSMGHGALYLR